MRRICRIGTVALGLAGVWLLPVCIASARHVAQCLEEIQHTNTSLNPMERVVSGFMLISAPRAVTRSVAQTPRT